MHVSRGRNGSVHVRALWKRLYRGHGPLLQIDMLRSGKDINGSSSALISAAAQGAVNRLGCC